MARHSRRHSRNHRSRRHKMSGGSYSDAASYGMYVNGTGDSQWNRTMDQSGPYGQIQGNVIIGAQGQNVAPVSQVPNAGQLALIQKAGRRRSKKGGFIGEMINQAIVPLSILGMQQTYRRKRGGRRTRRHRKH